LPLQRVPEPELMDDGEQACAYAEADFSESNTLFVGLFEDLLGGRSLSGAVVDLGCGPGDIALRLARRHPGVRFDLVDGAEVMLTLAREAWAQAGLASRARMVCARLGERPLPEARYDAVISNSLLHHLGDPSVLWRVARRCAAPGAPVLVMDLRRPESPEEQDRLVETYAAGAPEVLRRDFRNSLAAAYTLEEVASQLHAAGLGGLRVAEVSNRHLAVAGVL
jgi:ubiquinone/menaquinone biosynthesis C-methylase UbiE